MAEMKWKTTNDLLEEAKNSKKQALSQSCQDDILSGFEVEIDGEGYEFSYDREAQINYHERWQLFQNEVITSITMTAHKGEEDVRIEVDKEMFNEIYFASVLHKEDKIRRLREDIFPIVDMAQSEEELESISWEMDIVVGGKPSVEIKDDKLLDKEIKRIELETAISSGEMMNLIFMGQLGGML